MSRQLVKFDSENATSACPGSLQGDVKATPRGLIVLQEWWGMNDQIQDEAKELGNLGKFVTLVPDLYRGKVAIDRETAGHYMEDLDWQGAVKDIQGAAKYLQSIGCRCVGVTGFCMGGALAMAAAALVPEITAAVPFYGIPSSELADPASIKIPIQCHFGKNDDMKGFTSKEDYDALRKKLEAGGVNFELYEYDAGHAFTNHNRPEAYSAESTKVAFERMIKFMNDNLK